MIPHPSRQCRTPGSDGHADTSMTPCSAQQCLTHTVRRAADRERGMSKVPCGISHCLGRHKETPAWAGSQWEGVCQPRGACGGNGVFRVPGYRAGWASGNADQVHPMVSVPWVESPHAAPSLHAFGVKMPPDETRAVLQHRPAQAKSPLARLDCCHRSL